MEVSVIMSSFNRYPQVLLSLFALEKQTFDLSKMEVILVDDASTDDTLKLRDYTPPFKFLYFRNEKGLGVAASRNEGIKKAQGKIIILLDAEMIVDPDYVKNNYKHHLNQDNVVVVGGGVGFNIYSFLFPEFNSKQKKGLKLLAKSSKKVKTRINNVIEGKGLRQFLSELEHPVPLIEKKDIENFTQLRPFTEQKKLVNNILSELGDNFQSSPIAWLVCLGNISLRKSLINKVGGYDTNFTHWGGEDREFAYRLYKAGAKFIVDPLLIRYHQEHPEPLAKRKEWRKNLVYFQHKHPTLEVCICIRSLGLIRGMDYLYIEKVLIEHSLLSEEFPNRYSDFEQSIILMLQQIMILKSERKPVKNLLLESGYGVETMRRKKIFLQRDEINYYEKFGNLVQLFDLLVST